MNIFFKKPEICRWTWKEQRSKNKFVCDVRRLKETSGKKEIT